MQLIDTSIPGCFEIRFVAHTDRRGSFVKTTASSIFQKLGLDSDFNETFYSVSGENVIRGMHLQLPPSDQIKLVYCVTGAVMDVALDLRKESPTFGKYAVMELSAERHNAAYLPAGVAHGFYVREAPATMCYHMSAEYSPACDTGVAWDSFGVVWPTDSPVISARDTALPPLGSFVSPF